MTNELVTFYLAWHPEIKKQLDSKVYPELLQFVKGLSRENGDRSLSSPRFVTATIATKMLLLSESPSSVTGRPIVVQPDQNVFDFDVENPFWSEQRVYFFFAAITAVIGEQPTSTVVQFFKYLAAIAIDEVTTSRSSSNNF